jgi:hypothetical protein
LRWIALVAGVALVALSVGAVTRVADTHEGLVAEIVTLLSALAGISLLIYALTARPRPSAAAPPPAPPAPSGPRPRVRRDLVLGSGGLALALVLLAGLAVSGGALWASFGLALLLPMIAGSVYLCLRFLRSEP